MGDQLKLRGVLKGHGGWVTAIATTPEDPTMILTASRDKVSCIHNKFKISLLKFRVIFIFYLNRRRLLSGLLLVTMRTMVMLAEL
jgi:hypothetical protein